eukprot:624228-Pyramimonas_sp.AAC.1
MRAAQGRTQSLACHKSAGREASEAHQLTTSVAAIPRSYKRNKSPYDNTIVTTGVKHVKFLEVPRAGLTKGTRMRPKKGIISKMDTECEEKHPWDFQWEKNL